MLRSIFPFDEYDMNAVRAPFTVHAGATLAGTVKIFASGEYQYFRFRQIAPEYALLTLHDGARCVRTVQGDVTQYCVYGDVTLNEPDLMLADGMSLSQFSEYMDLSYSYKVNGNLRFVLYDGTITLSKRMELLPGFAMVVGRGAVLQAEAGATAFFCTGEACDFGGKHYLSFYDYDGLYTAPEKRYTAGRGDAALYILDGGKVQGEGLFVGRIYTDESSSFASASTAHSASVNVAWGDPATSNFGVNEYELETMHETLTGDALAAARARLGLD